MTNIESNNSQNGGLEDYNIIFEKIFPYFITPYPNLNTQSCIRGLLVVRYFCFWAV